MKTRKKWSPETRARVMAARWANAPTLAERFWPKVDKAGADGCWLWIGAKNNRGYGNFGVVFDGKWHCVVAHRVAWELCGRVLPPPKAQSGLVLDHVCKKPACVNPDHLRIVSQVDNCTIHARPTPFTKNAKKTHCSKGHPYEGANLAIKLSKGRRRQDGSHMETITRICLTCFPAHWDKAVVRRDGPPGARKQWTGPDVR